MMREFIVQGHTETAMALMSQKEPAYLIELGKKTLEFIIFIGSQNSTDVNLRNTCCGMLNRLWHKLSAICNNNVQQEILLRDIRIAKALYVVNEMCGMEINYSSLLWCKKQDLDRLLTCMINELPENDLSDYKTLIGNCTKLASCLQQPLPFIFLKIMTLGGNLNMLLKIGENLWEISVNADLLIKGALVLLSYSRQDSINIENETFMNVIVAAQANQINSQEDMEVIKLSRKLCVKALLSHNKTNDCTLSLILEVIQWIDNLYYLSHINANVQLQIDPQRIYVGHWFSPNRSIGFIFHINNLLNSNSDFSYFKSSELINRDQLANDLENFICDTRTLLKQEQYMIAYNIVKMVQQTSLKYEETREVISKTLQTFMSETIIPEVIVSLLAEHTIDENLVFSLMLNFDADMIQNQVRMYLLKYKKQPNKLGNIAKIGRSLLANKGIDHGIQDLLNIEKKCKWWFKIKETAINYSIFFTNSPEKLLNTLIKNDLIATDNLQEYCTDFQLNLQECYLKYIKTVLLKWQPDVEYIKEINGKEDIIIKNSEADLEAVVLKVLNHIHDKNEILKLIDQIWPLINFYYYEVYLALISIRTIVSTGEDAFAKVYKPLLSFLKSYKRVSAPSHTETEQWYASQLHKTILDPLSKYRLPLSTSFLSKDIWTIIKQEVNLNTYKQWFKVSEFLKDHLDPRDICTYAINSILPNGSAATWSNDWDLTSKYDEDICKVDECAENMQDYERATVAINALMHGVPPGADKVQIAELAFKYAELYFRTFPNEEVEKIFNKVKQRYFNYTAIHILHKYELANNRCLEQVSQPILLIGELYKDPRIDSYFDDISFELPDINSAVQELCHFFELDFTHECKNILKALWTVESPLIFDCKRLSRKNLSSNLKRACYVCNSDPAFWQRFAWKHITSNNEDLSLKANAIICLYYISNENMGEFLDVNLGDFIDYMSKICLIAKLGDLGIPCMSVEELDSQNQKRLLKQLAKIPNQLAIKCIAMLCKIYGYDDIKYWEYIVNSAIEFHTVSELREYLEFLSNRCVCDYIKKGWQTVLSKAFAKFDWKTLSEAEIFLLLEASPVFELNLKPFMEICMHNNRPDIAAILKQFSKN
ncbi:hypothetical protein ABEB36_009153 [Hypothenemus hampei]|uniref:RZZ complex subunit KNTC1/ROD C-terminal domain-containing protein n=1 Tax=Hypothenemus hampei TaxID=57062 RepID=A0ABD1EPB0_HYPHA